MSDLVERLRKLADRERPYGSLPDTLEEAAARIEQLEAALDRLYWYAERLEIVVYDDEDDGEHEVMEQARAALEDKP